VIPYCAKVMNAFTPNRDGSNDLWLVTNGAPCTNRIRAAVYNRYGQEVYKSENYQNNWDGTYNGKPVPDGTYYYAVTYYFIGGRQVILKGDVTILR
jgi:gliding motility-associated-like protein